MSYEQGTLDGKVERILTEAEVRAGLERLTPEQLIELVRDLGEGVEKGEVPTDGFMDEMDLTLEVLKGKVVVPGPRKAIPGSPVIVYQGAGVSPDGKEYKRGEI